MNDVQHPGFYSVIADEGMDVANQEQLAISIHFISNSQICGKLITFHKCDIGVLVVLWLKTSPQNYLSFNYHSFMRPRVPRVV